MSKWTQKQKGALWKKQNKNGKYLTGYVVINGKKQQITIFANKYKEGQKNRPDFIVYETFSD